MNRIPFHSSEAKSIAAEPEANDPQGYVRIVDESGEDNLYPRDWFVAIDLPQAAIDAREAA